MTPINYWPNKQSIRESHPEWVEIIELEPKRRIAELSAALQGLLAASERHIFGDECLAERAAARAAIAYAGRKL